MKPLKEYGDDYKTLMADLNAATSVPAERRAIIQEFNRLRLVARTRSRIEKFLKDRGEAHRTELFKGLNIKRVGAQIAEAALNELYIEQKVYPKQGPVHTKGGRRGVLLVWNTEPATATIPQAIIDEVEEDPKSQELVPQPSLLPSVSMIRKATPNDTPIDLSKKSTTLQEVIDYARSTPSLEPIVSIDAEPALTIANDVIKELLKPSPGHRWKTEEEQVAEFRKNELPNEPAPEEKPKKSKRSALLEGLSS